MVSAFFSQTASGSARAILECLLRIMQSNCQVQISDSVVNVYDEGIHTDTPVVGQMADLAIELAQLLGRRRSEPPVTPREGWEQAEWNRFAVLEGLDFDSARMKIRGQSRGAAVEIALETEGQNICTAMTVGFPRALDVAFMVMRTTTPGFLQGIFSQDIVVGHGPFDDMYKVTGYPEAVVRQLLARPPLLGMLAELGTRSREVQMSHVQLFFRVPAVHRTAEELRGLMETGLCATDTFFAQARQVVPYR